jgi:hypothetical protein
LWCDIDFLSDIGMLDIGLFAAGFAGCAWEEGAENANRPVTATAMTPTQNLPNIIPSPVVLIE